MPNPEYPYEPMPLTAEAIENAKKEKERNKAFMDKLVTLTLSTKPRGFVNFREGDCKI